MLTILSTVATVTTLTAAALFALPVTAGATTCSTPWGSTPKAVTNFVHGNLAAVRAGHHDCFDRVVLDDSRANSGYRVHYVSAVHDQGRGAVVPLRGGAFLEVVDQSAAGRLAMPSVAGFPTLRQVASGGSFEGYTTVGVGVRARLPFRVFRSGTHLVVDVAHHW